MFFLLLWKFGNIQLLVLFQTIKQQNGTQASAPSTRQTDQWEDQKKRWEDEINDFPMPEETEETKGNEIKNNDTWIKVAKNRERWKVKT